MGKIEIIHKIIVGVNSKSIDIAEIQVYRCSKEKFKEELKKKKARFIDRLNIPQKSEAYKKSEAYFESNYGHPWRYNELIGFIRVSFKESIIKFQNPNDEDEIQYEFIGSFFKLKERISSRMRKKTFTYDFEPFFEFKRIRSVNPSFI